MHHYALPRKFCADCPSRPNSSLRSRLTSLKEFCILNFARNLIVKRYRCERSGRRHCPSRECGRMHRSNLMQYRRFKIALHETQMDSRRSRAQPAGARRVYLSTKRVDQVVSILDHARISIDRLRQLVRIWQQNIADPDAAVWCIHSWPSSMKSFQHVSTFRQSRPRPTPLSRTERLTVTAMSDRTVVTYKSRELPISVLVEAPNTSMS